MSAPFQIEEYHRPRDVAQAVEILSKYGKKTRVIAGGTDILPRRPGLKKINPIHHLVDIAKLDLNYIINENDPIRIGAATTINAIGACPQFLSGPYRALSEAAAAHSTPTIKNRATVGGNLCNASPCADLALPLLVLDAVLVAAGPNGQREIPMADFFKGPNFMALGSDEVLLEIHIPRCPDKAGSSFIKLRRQQTVIDMAIVNVATYLIRNKGRCEIARIALGAVAPISIRAKKAESMLAGEKLTGESIQKAAATAAGEARPVDDIRATAAYRKKMLEVLVRRSLENSLQRCG
ncbi:MAG: xanthine dehydrogenase family protein subunit M [Desulfobacteraceae bacterium]|jgi:carbon-monoxide dehydrogenase medium subunit|nr:xanthine dehydrogenase family protein subunit M [Desulfobacteraceae bacterium]